MLFVWKQNEKAYVFFENLLSTFALRNQMIKGLRHEGKKIY